MQFKQHVCISAYLNLSMLFIITKPVELEPNVKFFSFFLGGGGVGWGLLSRCHSVDFITCEVKQITET